MKSSKTLSVMVLSLSTVLTGCYKTVRTVQLTTAPDVYRSTSIENLEKMVSDRDAAIKSLKADVEMSFTTGGGRTGKETEYGPFKGYIFVRKPGDLRVLMLVPVLGSRALDMVSDKDNFTLMYKNPHGGPDIWRQGSNNLSTHSTNALENLRPPVFFDSLLVPGVMPGESVALPESTRLIQPDKRGKPAIEEPDYDLQIQKPKSEGVMQIERIVHISRITMLPFQQDIYDDQGRVVTEAIYDQYKDFNGQQFPMSIIIKRPQEQLSMKLIITNLQLNVQFDEDQFQLEVPPGVTVQKMQ
jgi:outer membrane lipoprotein-sorting protein